jgi:hypothetical protein
MLQTKLKIAIRIVMAVTHFMMDFYLREIGTLIYPYKEELSMFKTQGAIPNTAKKMS